MSFIEQRLPDDQSYGGSGGPVFNTDIVATASGFEHRNANWSQARGRWDIGFTRNQTQLDALIAFFRVCAGRANGFRYKDHADYQVSISQGIIGIGVGDGTPTLQLKKRYTSGSSTFDRDIKKPVTSPAAAIYRGGVLKTVTTHYTIDTTTGLLTWVYDATSNASSVTVGATTQVVLAANPGTLIAGQKLYLTGFTGILYVGGLVNHDAGASGSETLFSVGRRDSAGANSASGTVSIGYVGAAAQLSCTFRPAPASDGTGTNAAAGTGSLTNGTTHHAGWLIDCRDPSAPVIVPFLDAIQKTAASATMTNATGLPNATNGIVIGATLNTSLAVTESWGALTNVPKLRERAWPMLTSHDIGRAEALLKRHSLNKSVMF